MTRPANTPIFDIAFDVNSLGKDEKACWHSLFTTAVIAKGFHIPERDEEIGLEIPLPMMAALIGVRHAVEFEGGLLLKGFSSVFVLVKRYKDSVQWHYLENDNEVRLPYWAVESQYLGRAMLGEVDYKTLNDSRAIVGWWTTTETHLGTATANYENIDWSVTKEVGRSTTLIGGTLGFQQIVSRELSFALGPKDGKLHVQRNVTKPRQRKLTC
jgi:hypothetical protein